MKNVHVAGNKGQCEYCGAESAELLLCQLTHSPRQRWLCASCRVIFRGLWRYPKEVVQR